MRNFLICFFFVGTAASASPLQHIHVFPETDDEDTRQCGLSSIAAVAATESVFRQNRVPIRSERDANIFAYVNLTVIKTSVTCVVSSQFQIFVYTNASLPGNTKSILVRGELCEKGGTLTGLASSLQARVNDQYRSFTERCISEIERKLNR